MDISEIDLSHDHTTQSVRQVIDCHLLTSVNYGRYMSVIAQQAMNILLCHLLILDHVRSSLTSPSQ